MAIQSYATAAALLLSVLNTITLLIRNRPLAILESWRSDHEPANRLHLRIINPSDQPAQIAGLLILPSRGNLNIASANGSIRGASMSAYRWLSHKVHKKFYQFILPKADHLFEISNIETPVLLIFFWHRNRVLNIRFPLLRLISPKRASVINEEYPDIPI